VWAIFAADAQTGDAMMRGEGSQDVSADSNTASLDGLPASQGEYYDAVVPATLDLVERAKLGILHFISILDEGHGHQMRWTGNPTDMTHGRGIFAICQPKAFEAMAMLRVVSGSRHGLQREAQMVEMMAGVPPSAVGPLSLLLMPRPPSR